MVKKDGEERRVWVRAKRALSIEYRIVRNKKNIPNLSCQISVTEDMSVGGLSFYTNCVCEVGDILDVHVIMSGVLDIFNGQVKVIRVGTTTKKASCFLVAVKFEEQPKREKFVKKVVKKVVKKRRKIK